MIYYVFIVFLEGTGRYHGLLMLESPPPGGHELSGGGKRLKSVGTHNTGFETEAEALADAFQFAATANESGRCWVTVCKARFRLEGGIHDPHVFLCTGEQLQAETAPVTTPT